MNRNTDQLLATAKLLQPLLPELVFVGGSVTSLLVTDPGATEPRHTFDVDAIAEITSYSAYATFGSRLRALGFSEDSREGAPVCRWVHGTSIFDIMPLDEKVLGFSNRWYRPAMQNAQSHFFDLGLTLRVITAPYFLATKIEAFQGRGKRDYQGSHDLEDFVLVLDGRSTIVDEVKAQPLDLRDYLRIQISNLLRSPAFTDALPGFLPPDPASQARLPVITSRLQDLAHD